MAKKNEDRFRTLQILNLFVCIVAVSVVVLLHSITENFYDSLRLPQFLQAIDGQLGAAYPISLHIYQSILIFAVIISGINALGLRFYRSKKWRLASDLGSFLSLFVMWPAVLFFLFIAATGEGLSSRTIQTAAFYFAFTFVVLFIHFFTWLSDEQAILKR